MRLKKRRSTPGRRMKSEVFARRQIAGETLSEAKLSIGNRHTEDTMQVIQKVRGLTLKVRPILMIFYTEFSHLFRSSTHCVQRFQVLSSPDKNSMFAPKRGKIFI